MGTNTPAGTAPVRLEVEIWSDVVCPWCYIGKRRFERALDQLTGEIDVGVVYRPYQLDPTASPGTSTPVVQAYAKKFGSEERARQIIGQVTEVAAGEGLAFRMDIALRANTLLAHRLLWASETGALDGDQVALKERLLHAYFVDGLDIGDPDVLASCAAEVGIDAVHVTTFLEGDGGTAEVQAFLHHATEHDITAVPTYIISDPNRKANWIVPGAQDTETFVQVLRKLAAKIVESDAPGIHHG